MPLRCGLRTAASVAVCRCGFRRENAQSNTMAHGPGQRPGIWSSTGQEANSHSPIVLAVLHSCDHADLERVTVSWVGRTAKAHFLGIKLLTMPPRFRDVMESTSDPRYCTFLWHGNSECPQHIIQQKASLVQVLQTVAMGTQDVNSETFGAELICRDASCLELICKVCVGKLARLIPSSQRFDSCVAHSTQLVNPEVLGP
mmetsp:Transcript_39998/g.70939  ORF Transcript_39998/g.70939 Transcript_39998/m.70939 type:complete len:200 (-) Transcript_39998:57-656(-)